MNARDGAKSAQLLYILGDGRSGSSLLDLCLGSHPHVTSTGEVHRISIAATSRECACGEIIAQCPYWLHALTHIRRERPDVDDWSKFPVTAGREAFGVGRTVAQLSLLTGVRPLITALSKVNGSLAAQQQAAINSWSLFSALTEINGSFVVVDSSKSPGRMKSLHAERIGTMKVIYLVRDGRAVAASEMRRTGSPMSTAARIWRNDNVKSQRVLATLPSSQVLKIRYEDFCLRPLDTLNRVYAALRLPTISHFSITPVEHRHMIPGNPMLYGEVTGVRLDERWRRELSNEDLHTFDRIAGRMNSALGY